MPIIHIVFEILKSIFLKGAIRKIFSFKALRDVFIIFSGICAVVIFWYTFKLQEYTKTGSEHFRYSNFISSEMKPKINDTISDLFNERKENNAYFFISLVEISFKKVCKYRWKYIRGFNEGTIKSFENIKKANVNYKEKTLFPCSEKDTKEKLIALSNSRIRVDINNSDKNLLHTQERWLDDEKTNYKVAYLTYFIKPYDSNNQFYMLQVASLKPLKKIIEINLFESALMDLMRELHIITEPKKWYEILDR